jgi:hypothetical protein
MITIVAKTQATMAEDQVGRLGDIKETLDDRLIGGHLGRPGESRLGKAAAASAILNLRGVGLFVRLTATSEPANRHRMSHMSAQPDNISHQLRHPNFLGRQPPVGRR